MEIVVHSKNSLFQ